MKAILGHFLVLCLLQAVLRPYINLTPLVQRAVARYFLPAPTDGSSYDFVVVGAGTAGCTVAGRLAQQGKYSVLLLEAGGPSHWMMGVPFFMPAFLVGAARAPLTLCIRVTTSSWIKVNRHCFADIFLRLELLGRTAEQHHGRHLGPASQVVRGKGVGRQLDAERNAVHERPSRRLRRVGEYGLRRLGLRRCPAVF